MRQDLVWKGREYTGHFSGSPCEKAFMYRGDTHERHERWWEGECRIEGPEGTARAYFSTNISSAYFDTLEAALVQFRTRDNPLPRHYPPQIQNQEAFYDFMLKRMQQRVQDQLKDHDIPRIYFGGLIEEDLPPLVFKKD